jgi:hypothetical protein
VAASACLAATSSEITGRDEELKLHWRSGYGSSPSPGNFAQSLQGKRVRGGPNFDCFGQSPDSIIVRLAAAFKLLMAKNLALKSERPAIGRAEMLLLLL